MTDQANQHCWSCTAEAAAADAYCSRCGASLRSGASPSVNIHGRLVSVEKMLWRTAIGVGLILLLIGWLLLQTYHFGKGGFLGELRTPTPSVALDQTRLHPLL